VSASFCFLILPIPQSCTPHEPTEPFSRGMTARDILLCSVHSYHRLPRVFAACIMAIAELRPRLPHCVLLYVGRVSPWAQRSNEGCECLYHPYLVPDLRRPQLGKERLRKYVQMAHGHIIIRFSPRPICGHGV
jgi:hypothetical protein